MAQSIKFKNNTYIDSSEITHSHDTIKTLLNVLNIHQSINYADLDAFLNAFKTFRGYAVHVGYVSINNVNGFFIGYYQSYANGYGKVIVLTAWNNYICQLNNGTWNISNISTS